MRCGQLEEVEDRGQVDHVLSHERAVAVHDGAVVVLPGGEEAIEGGTGVGHPAVGLVAGLNAVDPGLDAEILALHVPLLPLREVLWEAGWQPVLIHGPVHHSVLGVVVQRLGIGIILQLFDERGDDVVRHVGVGVL